MREELSQIGVALAGASCLFRELPSAALRRIFSRLDLSGGHFQRHLLHGIAKLLNHKHCTFVRQRDNTDTAGVVHHVPLNQLAVLQFRLIPGDIEHLSLIGLFTAFGFFL